jgi:transcriptional regulator with XRE-family HTH domain
MDNICSEELRKARESQNISLDDLTAATRISKKFLKAIEDGEFSMLPQIYIRAFIRDYAREVGLNPDEVIKKYEHVIMPLSERETQKITATSVSPAKVRLPRRAGATQSTILILTAVILIGALVATILFFNREKKSDVKEIPFQSVIEEQGRPKISKPDTTKLIGPELPKFDSTLSYISGDSLILYASATESAWISVVMDEKVKREILLLPNQSTRWKAVNQFNITIGSAGSTIFKLNDKVIGSIGKRGAVVRDYVLTRKSLEEKH